MSPRLLESLHSTTVDGVQISMACLGSFPAGDVKDLARLLDAVERARAARFRFERDRKRYIASHGVLRHLLGAALGKPASELAFEYGTHGKPRLAMTPSLRPPVLHFNLSHSEDWAMFALAWDGEVGIDLEASTRLGDEQELIGLAAHVLSARELTMWHALPDVFSRRTALLRAWTRKEAYSKALGEGVFNGLREIELALEIGSRQESLTIFSSRGNGRATRAWKVREVSAPQGFAAALAIEQK